MRNGTNGRVLHQRIVHPKDECADSPPENKVNVRIHLPPIPKEQAFAATGVANVTNAPRGFAGWVLVAPRSGLRAVLAESFPHRHRKRSWIMESGPE
jgi:hypothetical protein